MLVATGGAARGGAGGATGVAVCTGADTDGAAAGVAGAVEAAEVPRCGVGGLAREETRRLLQNKDIKGKTHSVSSQFSSLESVTLFFVLSSLLCVRWYSRGIVHAVRPCCKGCL